MTTRQFLPIAGFLFVAFVAAMWAYISGPDEDLSFQLKGRHDDRTREASEAGGRRNGPAHLHVGGALSPSKNAEWGGPGTASPGRKSPSLGRALRRRWPAWRHRIDRLAGVIDAAGVRFRSHLARRPLIQLAAGWYALQCGRPEAAVRRFDRLLVRQPANTSALAGKASALIAQRRYGDAADVYSHLISEAPWDVAARYNHGVVLSRLGRFGAAARAFRAVLRREPEHAAALHNLAGLAQRDGRLTEARDAWEAFTQLRPNHATAWFHLGVVYLDSGRPFEAAQCFSAAVSIDPDDADAYVNLAVADMRAAHLESALAALNIANELWPCQAVIMQKLAELHRVMAAWSPLDEAMHLAAAELLEEQLGLLVSASSSPLVAGRSLDAQTD